MQREQLPRLPQSLLRNTVIKNFSLFYRFHHLLALLHDSDGQSPHFPLRHHRYQSFLEGQW